MIKDFGYALETVLLLLNVFIVNLIYQLNYSYIKNKNADIELFENSIFYNAFNHFQEIYKRYNEKRKWTNYSKSFKRKTTFIIIKYS